MNKKGTIEWINSIINELVDPNKNLKDILLKVQVLSFKIKNDKLKTWVNNELNGYIGKEIASYRKIPSAPFGNLIQDLGFGGMRTRNNYPLPFEYLEEEIRNSLMIVNMTASVAELELMVVKEGDFQINIPHIIFNEITKLLTNNWVIESAWQRITQNNIEGIISSIKSNLLTFVLELADEIGENENIDLINEEQKIDNLFDKTIGNLTGDTVNITIGSDNIQTLSTGKNAKMNVAKGDNIKQSITEKNLSDLSSFINELKEISSKSELNKEDREDVEIELSRIEKQLSRKQPKYPIIKEGLKVVNGILTGVTGNLMAPEIIERLQWFIELFGV